MHMFINNKLKKCIGYVPPKPSINPQRYTSTYVQDAADAILHHAIPYMTPPIKKAYMYSKETKKSTLPTQIRHWKGFPHAINSSMPYTAHKKTDSRYDTSKNTNVSQRSLTTFLGPSKPKPKLQKNCCVLSTCMGNPHTRRYRSKIKTQDRGHDFRTFDVRKLLTDSKRTKLEAKWSGEEDARDGGG